VLLDRRASRPDANGYCSRTDVTRSAIAVALLSLIVSIAVSADELRLVSRGPAPAGANGESAVWTLDPPTLGPSISRDGRFVLFISQASNIAPVETRFYPVWDLYLHDTLTMTTQRVSGSGAGTGDEVVDRSISDDGRFVVFLPSLGPGTAFLFDRTTGTRIAIADGCSRVAISGDGRVVVFASASTGVVPGQQDANTSSDVFLLDVATGVKTIVSRKLDSPLTTSNADSFPWAISRDGRLVLFWSTSTDLLAGQAGSAGQLFLFDRSNGGVRLVSRRAGMTTVGTTGGGSWASMSPDGRYVAFLSLGTDLVPGQVAGSGLNVFLHDVATSTTVLVSHRSGSPLTEGTPGGRFNAAVPRVSGDGRYVAFISSARDLVPYQVPGTSDNNIFLYDRSDDSMRLASAAGGSTMPASGNSELVGLTAEGSVTFTSLASDVLPGQIDPNASYDLFVFDRREGSTRLVSHSLASPLRAGNGLSWRGSASADGDHIAFSSRASDLIPDDSNAQQDVFLYSLAVRPPPGPQSFHTLDPCRLVDTRSTPGGSGGPALAAGNRRFFPVAGHCGVPSSAKSVILNLTVTQGTAEGNLRLFAGSLAPLASSINYRAGQTRANSAIAFLGPGGEVTVQSDQASGSVHVILDISGYFE